MSVLVIGGGPAGAAAAAVLARAGRAVTVLERETAPADKVCGDFLSGEALTALGALGVDAATLGAAPITHARFIHGQREGRLRLPFAAAGLSRRALDAALLDAAAAVGAEVRRGAAVRTLRPEGRGFVAEGPDRAASRVLLATGKHGLRGAPRPAVPGDLVGIKTYYRLAPAQAEALRGHVEIVTYDGGYAGLQPVEGGRANLCLLVEAGLLRAAGGPEAVIARLCAAAPHLGLRLVGATVLLDRPLAVAGLAYGHVHAPNAADPAGLYRLGDQAAVIPSLAGDGIAIALHTGRLAAAAVLAGAEAGAYHARLRRDLAGQVGRATLVHRAIARPLGRAALVATARRLPGLVRTGARMTRVVAQPSWS